MMLQMILLNLLLPKNSLGENDADLKDRLGLLGPTLGLHPTGGLLDDDEDDDIVDSSPLLALSDPFASSQCCCFDRQAACPDPFGPSSGSDLVSLGVLNTSAEAEAASPSLQLSEGLLFSLRISPLELVTETECPEAMKSCCYDQDIDLGAFDVPCVSPEGARDLAKQEDDERWLQLCEKEETIDFSDQCGFREFLPNNGEISPGEFPWSCLLLTEENGFVGNCALIPDEKSSDGRSSTKVLTAAHKLNRIKATSKLKVRLGEFDASGFRSPEEQNFTEVFVAQIIKHPQFSPRRLSFDAAVLILDEEVRLKSPFHKLPGLPINSACLPLCDSQFSHVFSNGSGATCWLSGWRVDRDSHVFQPLMTRDMVTLLPDTSCDQDIRTRVGGSFSLSESELCALRTRGDTCAGHVDGGAGLVCQSEQGRWTLAGILTWSLDTCHAPLVFLDVANIMEWIQSI